MHCAFCTFTQCNGWAFLIFTIIGNSWGTDPDGTSCVGCGNQETFRACADVRIIGNYDDGANANTENDDDDNGK